MRSFESYTSTPLALMGIGFSSVGSNEQDHPNRPGDVPKVVQKDLKHLSRTTLSWQLLSKMISGWNIYLLRKVPCQMGKKTGKREEMRLLS